MLLSFSCQNLLDASMAPCSRSPWHCKLCKCSSFSLELKTLKQFISLQLQSLFYLINSFEVQHQPRYELDFLANKVLLLLFFSWAKLAAVQK